MGIKEDIEDFLKKTGITCYRLGKEAGVAPITLHYLLKGKRLWMLNRTEQRLRVAMKRLLSDVSNG